MTTVRELRDAILAIRKRNSPPLNTLSKGQLTTLLAELQGKTQATPAKKVETPAPAPKTPASKTNKIAELRESIKKKKMEMKSARAAPAPPAPAAPAAPAFKLSDAEVSERMKKAQERIDKLEKQDNVFKSPWIYKKKDIQPWLKLAVQILNEAIQYSKKNPPAVRTRDDIGMGIVYVRLQDVPVMKHARSYARSLFYTKDYESSLFVKRSAEHSERTECWLDDIAVNWDWEENKKTNTYSPKNPEDARLGFRWKYPNIEEDFNRNSHTWENVMRVYLDIQGGKTIYNLHARTEFERSDDSEVDRYAMRELKKLVGADNVG